MPPLTSGAFKSTSGALMSIEGPDNFGPLISKSTSGKSTLGPLNFGP